MNYKLPQGSEITVSNAIYRAIGGHACFLVRDEDVDQIEWNDETIDQPSRESILVALEELKQEFPWHLLRGKRDFLISETDWWVLPDRTPTEAQLAYRQDLRDLPSNTIDPENPIWPVKPE